VDDSATIFYQAPTQVPDIPVHLKLPAPATGRIHRRVSRRSAERSEDPPATQVVGAPMDGGCEDGVLVVLQAGNGGGEFAEPVR